MIFLSVPVSLEKIRTTDAGVSPEGQENCFDFVRNDDSGLDLYVETGDSAV